FGRRSEVPCPRAAFAASCRGAGARRCRDLPRGFGNAARRAQAPAHGGRARRSTVKLIKVAAAVLNQTPLDWEGNRAHILAAIETARRQNVSILCLPELCITG